VADNGQGQADPATARFEQLEASYGTEDTALRVTDAADILPGVSPLLRAVLRQAARCRQVRRQWRHRTDPLAAGRAGADGWIRRGIPAQIEFSTEQSCWAGARCKVLPSICMPTPNPVPSTKRLSRTRQPV
jgi:large subunit ribosomal protein L24